MTGFVAGQQSWPFAGMLSLAGAGHRVRSIEDFDPRGFIENPAAEIRRQTGDDGITTHVLEVSDVEQQRKLVEECLASPNIAFDARIPDISDIRTATANPGTAVICNVNYLALAGKPGYNGHFVLIERFSGSSLRLQNPGLPPLENQDVPLNHFLKAWRGPENSLANLLIASTNE